MASEHPCQNCGKPVEYAGAGRPRKLCNRCRGVVPPEPEAEVPAGEVHLRCPRCKSRDALVTWRTSPITSTVMLQGACPDCQLHMEYRVIPT